MQDEIRNWEELSREEVFRKYNRRIEKVIFKLPDGQEADYYIKKEGPAVCTLAITKNNEIILAKQFRPGPKEILLEIPGGGIETNETPEQAAERELLEETGYKGNIQLVTESVDCAYSTMRRYCMVATDCVKISEQKLDKTEFAEVVLVSLDEFRNHLRKGRLSDIEVGYLGLDFLHLL
jgi:ADP-ribose pyrophosphatase